MEHYNHPSNNNQANRNDSTEPLPKIDQSSLDGVRSTNKPAQSNTPDSYHRPDNNHTNQETEKTDHTMRNLAIGGLAIAGIIASSLSISHNIEAMSVNTSQPVAEAVTESSDTPDEGNSTDVQSSQPNEAPVVGSLSPSIVTNDMPGGTIDSQNQINTDNNGLDINTITGISGDPINFNNADVGDVDYAGYDVENWMEENGYIQVSSDVLTGGDTVRLEASGAFDNGQDAGAIGSMDAFTSGQRFIINIEDYNRDVFYRYESSSIPTAERARTIIKSLQ